LFRSRIVAGLSVLFPSNDPAVRMTWGKWGICQIQQLGHAQRQTGRQCCALDLLAAVHSPI
jgi:hypothetical protein